MPPSLQPLYDYSSSATFTYAADGQRRKMQIGNTTTIYCDDYQVNKNGSTEQRLHYINGPAGLCALIVQTISDQHTSREIYYLQTDYQGSIIAAYYSNGILYKSFAYDPWGRRRVGDNWTNYKDIDEETLITRGYCGHEHLDDFGTINMNGRIYDPRLGRFLSPDPYVQAPYNSQNYNRYSYCLNNPLKYTDPSGKLFKQLFAVIGAIMSPGAGLLNWMNGGSFIKGVCDNYASWRDFGKSVDNMIFNNGNNSHNSSTASTTYNGTPYCYEQQTWNGPETVCGIYFENLYDMSNFMWSKSEELQTEITGYILRDDGGKEYYWVNQWEGNIENRSNNPWYIEGGKQPIIDHKLIVAELHTHPSHQYDKNGYDGCSYEDYTTSKSMGIPVYSIGPTGVSMILALTSPYTRPEQFQKLAENRYNSRDDDGRLLSPRETNPYFFDYAEDWLKNPHLY